MTVEEKLRELGIELRPLSKPVANTSMRKSLEI